MSKKLLKYFCFSLLFLFTACAPKPKIAPPPLYEEAELSLEEIVARVGNDIDVLKAITDIRIEKNHELYDFVNASVLVKKPDWVHMRIYKFGMLVKDFVIKDKELYVLSGKGGVNLKKFGNEFHNAVFWWDDIKGGLLYKKGDEYIIRTGGKKIHLDTATLLPVKQEIVGFDRTIDIRYDEPKKDKNGFWYPSRINIFVGDFEFKVRLKKLLRNPALGEFDFKIPVESM
jgi:hypothetical protein